MHVISSVIQFGSQILGTSAKKKVLWPKNINWILVVSWQSAISTEKNNRKNLSFSEGKN